MFQIGFWELMLVLAISIWVLGPEKLPAIAKIAAKWISKAKQVYLGVKKEFEEEFTPPSSTPPSE